MVHTPTEICYVLSNKSKYTLNFTILFANEKYSFLLYAYMCNCVCIYIDCKME